MKYTFKKYKIVYSLPIFILFLGSQLFAELSISDTQIKVLGASTWEERENAQKKIINELKKEKDGQILKYLITVLKKEKDPEIYYRIKNILKDYYFAKVYDPNRKHGFIGLQLNQGAEIKINGTVYLPIEIVKPQPGFPGEKAGIKEGDLLIGVGDMKCSSKFTIGDFIMYIADLTPGTEIALKLYNNDKIFTKKIILTARPESMMSPDFKKDKKESFIQWLKKQLR